LGMEWCFVLAAYFGVVLGLRSPESGKIEGVLLLRHPGSVQHGETESLWSLFCTLRRIRFPKFLKTSELGKEFRRRADIFGEKTEEAHKKLASGDHWYLNVVAVDPACQGKGIASSLLRHVIKLADRDRVPIYLESTNPSNRAIYEAKGFSICQDIELKEQNGTDVQSLTGMLRPAQSAVS